MSPANESQATISLTTAKGPGALVFRRMTGQERLGRPFSIDLEMQCKQAGTVVEPKDLLGTPITVLFTWADGTTRYFHGHVTRFMAAGVYEG